MKYFFIAGEFSGDKHGAAIITSIIEKEPQATFSFLGGDLMQQVCKKDAVVHINDMAFMGFVEVLFNVRKINTNFKKAKKGITEFNPDVVVMIDYPGFNLRMAKWCKLHNYKVVYYISPSVWAWHKSRIDTIKKYVDVMICILPFEEAFYKKNGVNASYLGNPLYDQIKEFQPNPKFLSTYNITKPILALLPGSRQQEIDKILPVMIESCLPFKNDYEIVIAKSDNLTEELYKKYIVSNEVKLVPNEYYNILFHAQMAVVTSGTATLETALCNVPQVVVYKTNPITFAIAKKLVDIKYISLPNLITDKMLVKELIQYDCNVENIQRELNLIKEIPKKEHFYDELFKFMGSTGSANRIADKIIEIAKLS